MGKKKKLKKKISELENKICELNEDINALLGDTNARELVRSRYMLSRYLNGIIWFGSPSATELSTGGIIKNLMT